MGIPVFLLEFGRIIRMCCGVNGPCCQVFALVLNFDRWQRGLFYAIICIPCFVPDASYGYSRVAGFILFICGVLYVGKCFQKKKIPTYMVDPNAAPPTPNGPSIQ
uniref:Uncharacterized protein n=1 Tax=Acrobeloides nanus TaxID=290746 RepID=A0A914D471_9BILA